MSWPCCFSSSRRSSSWDCSFSCLPAGHPLPVTRYWTARDADSGFGRALGMFILSLLVLVPVDPSTTTTNLLASGAALLLGTGFAIWSVTILGHCFGLFPEVRGRVQRGHTAGFVLPFIWARSSPQSVSC